MNYRKEKEVRKRKCIIRKKKKMKNESKKKKNIIRKIKDKRIREIAVTIYL